mmetsp:Transcript_1694/g.3552  ORF Transcript_1694/g.3552 Transcript_1694/m.3552 type:complete len:89 (+) Transcript_1694:311-577(+)
MAGKVLACGDGPDLSGNGLGDARPVAAQARREQPWLEEPWILLLLGVGGAGAAAVGRQGLRGPPPKARPSGRMHVHANVFITTKMPYN